MSVSGAGQTPKIYEPRTEVARSVIKTDPDLAKPGTVAGKTPADGETEIPFGISNQTQTYSSEVQLEGQVSFGAPPIPVQSRDEIPTLNRDTFGLPPNLLKQLDRMPPVPPSGSPAFDRLEHLLAELLAKLPLDSLPANALQASVDYLKQRPPEPQGQITRSSSSW